MADRGFGIEIEDTYGEETAKADFDLDWFQDVDDVDFKLNRENVTKSGSSRMNKRARAGLSKPSGSTSADADLQRLAWYFFGFLDNYKYTAGSNNVNTHEFWGGEGKYLHSFRGMAVYDELIKYIRGLLIDGLKIEVSDDSMTVGADWLYKNEEADILERDGTITRPEELINDLFIMGFDVDIFMKESINALNWVNLNSVATSFSYEGKNNIDQDSVVGLGSYGPQIQAPAGKRENNFSIVTNLFYEIMRAILNAEYGEVGALEPSKCKLLQLPFRIRVKLCEVSDLELNIIFPRATLNVEYNMSGADVIEVTMNMETLGSETVTLADNTTEVTTDMYVKLVNNQGELNGETEESP